MKKKLLILLSLILVVCFSAFTFIACDDEESDNNYTSNNNNDNSLENDSNDNSLENNNHIVSGNLQLGANIIKQEGERIQYGEWQYWSDKTRVNLHEESDPIFNWSNPTPGTWTKVTVEVENLERGLDAIGFTYKVRIMNLKGKNGDGYLGIQDAALATQLKITVQKGNNVNHSFSLIDCAKEENYVELGSIDVGGETQQFTIKVEFPPLNGNDSVQGGQVIFDLQIIPTQYLPQNML